MRLLNILSSAVRATSCDRLSLLSPVAAIMSQLNVDRKLKHLFDGSELNVYDDNVLNLGVGAPGTDLLENCCDIFQQATQHRLRYEKESNASFLFQYGPTSGPPEVRNTIAQYFSKKYENPMKSEDLIITTGATQGLHFVLSTLIDLNGVIFVDEYTYMIALDAIKQFTTFDIVPIHLNDDGVDLAALEHALQQKCFKSKSKEFWAMYYTIPTYHNPTGILFSDAVCKKLIDLAHKYDFLILCDDVYNILNYVDTPPPKRLYAYDTTGGNVISNGSFSKIIGPGLRLGWLEVPSRLKPTLEHSGILNSGGCFNHYTAGILDSLFELRLAQQHIDTLAAAYKERMLSACAVLKADLPVTCTWLQPTGGYFIWIRLPEAVDAAEFLKYCLREEKIFFIPGPRFALKDVGRNCLRLSIAFHKKEKLIDGVTRFCAALQRFLKDIDN